MFRKSTIILIVFLASIGQSYSQYWYWARSIGGTNSDKATCVRSDANGNIIVAGYFSGNIDLGDGVTLNALTAGTSKEIFVVKYNPEGVCLWAFAGGGFFDDRVLGMDVDQQGNIYITGTFWSQINIGPYLVYDAAGMSGSDQCFVAKLDPNGNVDWATWAGGWGDDQGLDLTTDANGNSYVTGFMSGTTLYLGASGLSVGAINTGLHVYNYWAARIDSKGNWMWGKSFGNLPWDPLTFKYVERDIAANMDGEKNLYIAGGYDGSRAFDTTVVLSTGTGTYLSSSGGTDVFLMKMDSVGNTQWAISGGSHKDDWANGVSADSMGNVYVTGEHRDSLWFDDVLVRNYNKRDVFVVKFDAANGDAIWGKRAGSDTGSERGNDIYTNTHCKVLLTGDVGPKAKFGPLNTDSVHMLQTFVARMTVDGDWMWVTTGGSVDSSDRGNSIDKGPGNKIYVCGYFKNEAYYGAYHFLPEGKTDAFVSQLKDYTFIDSCETNEDTVIIGGYDVFANEQVQVFPNPANGILKIACSREIVYELFDIKGQLMMQGQEKQLDVSMLEPACYFIKIRSEEQEWIRKFVKM